MPRRILVTGASVAGNTAAWWLTRFGFEVDVVEKALAFREGGQNVDVRGSARDVLRRMDLEEAAFERTTPELGTEWVDEDNKTIARFEAGSTGSDNAPTAELEIRRGDIARLIYDSTRERASFRFGDSVQAVAQDGAGAEVTFASGERTRYDLVVVAEGVGSHTRELLFPGENKPRWMDLTIAYFSLPREPHDTDYARVYNTVHGRGATLKPARDNFLGAYIGIHKKPQGEHEWSPARQRQYMLDQFAGDGWEFPRILEAMKDVDDFYFDVLRQVRMERWSSGSVVLTGDAAWAPTPLSGIGTSLAIVGGYVLAGELARQSDPASAFGCYEKVMRPFVQEGQNIPKIVPRMLWPHNAPELMMMRSAMRVAGMPLVKKVFSSTFARDSNRIDLPDYAGPSYD
jgi:2-polyprenyl-6-methoxyphenol hydroxylase-like FAD-dependent oxidoreductase